jgi:signal transduction histidine kinase
MAGLPRFKLFSRSLSARVLWLTVGIILFVEIVILMPSLGRERQAWLWDRVTQGYLAAYSVAITGGGAAAVDPPTKAALLTLAGAESVTLLPPGKPNLMLTVDMLAAPDRRINLGQEGLLLSIWRADLSVLGLGGRQVEISADHWGLTDTKVRVIINGQALSKHLRTYVAHIAGLSVVIALVTGLLVFLALDRSLVRPMRVITASIVGFRRDPERAEQQELSRLGMLRDDEISGAARELAVMQDELRAALWRNARLAAVGTAMAKISHDLRNILSSALLVADRLQETAEPVVKKAANTLIAAVEQSADLLNRTVDFAREGPPAITRTQVALRGLVEEVAAVASPDDAVVVENLVPAAVVLPLDRVQIYRVLVNLMRNAREAGATRLRVSVECEPGLTKLLVADNGPGLPLKVQDNLFRPFTGNGRRGGTGLGLAIARDLIRAHGGELLLRQTGPGGTVFVMDLAVAEMAAE